MSMSTYVQAFRDMDGKFKQMMEVRQFCHERGVSFPKEVTDYFGSLVHESDECIKETMLTVPLRVSNPAVDMKDVYEIEVADIPKEVKTIRFVNSY